MHVCRMPWTSFGVQWHAQQQPSTVLCDGKPKTSAANFQSCLTSTSAPLRSGLALTLHLSDCSQGDPSCLAVGQTPVARMVRDHLNMANTSIQVSLQILLWGRTMSGILRFLKSPTPGNERLITSIDSFLSHWVGAPSPQRPIPSSLHAACNSQCRRCSKVKGSMWSASRSFASNPCLSSIATTS